MKTTNSVSVNLHDSQALIQIINANTTYCAWQRAGGKTGGGIGPRIQRLSQVMPRSQILLFSDTYDRLKKRIVPNIVFFLKYKLGMAEGEDFVLFKKPPEHFTEPLIKLTDFEHVISFRTGMALCLVSLHVEGSANAYNAQAAIGDEVKFCDEEAISTEVVPSLRGAEELFGHLPEYLSVWMFTDKYGPKIKWYLAKRKLVNHKAVEIVYLLQMKIFQLEEQLRDENISESTKFRIKQKIKERQIKANRIRKQLVYFSDMQPYENMKAVGEFYFRRQKRICKSQLEYDVAILNKDPDRVENTFYPALSKERHYHKHMNDTSDMQPLIVALDYQWRITPMPVAQWGILPGKTELTLNTVNAIHTLHPHGGIEKTVKAFCKYYEHRTDKTVFYLYDHTATGRRPDGISFKETTVAAFIAEDWTVIEVHIGTAPEHNIKHDEIKKLMAVDRMMFNDVRAENLLKSMQNAAVYTSAGKTKKDKTQEKKDNNDPVEQTDYSDAFDMIAWGVLVMNLVTPYQSGFIGDIS